MKFLVTGANGYLGRHVVRELATKGDVVACDLVQGQGFGDSRVEEIVGDVLHDEGLCRKLADVDVVVHLAWQDGFSHNAPSHLANLNSHLAFLLRMADAGVPRIAVMGSMHEIGYWEGAIREDTPCNPLSMYGIAKNALRQALSVALKNRKTKLQWLRGYYIYGDDRANHSVFTKILEAVEAGKKHFPFTSGKNKFDFVEVRRFAEMVAAAVAQDEVLGIINICSGEPRTLAAMVEQFIHTNALDITLDYGAFPDRPYDSPGCWGDATKVDMIMSREREMDQGGGGR